MLSVALPIFFGSLIIILATVLPINISQKSWHDSSQNYIAVTSSESASTRLMYITKYISTFFNQTNNDIKTIDSYIMNSLNNDLNIASNYDTYFGVSSIDSRIPPKDAYQYSFFSSTYMNGISSQSQLNAIDNYTLHDSSIYDNVLRAVYKSSDIYAGIYFGFQQNGFYRYYPYVSFNSYPSFTYTCDYNQQATVGYDPRCRIWYVIAQNDDDIHYTSPYIDALTGNVLITSSKRVIQNGAVIGVIGMDYSMNKVNDIILNNTIFGSGYTFLMDSTGLLISYPNLTLDSSATRSIFDMDKTVDPSVWTSILSSNQVNQMNQVNITKNNEPYVLLYQYIEQQGYYLVMLYPNSDVSTITDNISVSVKNIITSGTIGVVVIWGIGQIIVTCLVVLLAKKYAKTIIQLSKDIESIGKPNLQIELQEMAPVSAEFSNVNKNFGNLLVAVKFGNDAYYEGDLNKALKLYNDAEELMKVMKIQRGLSICYNNKANVYKQMGNITEAEKLYLESIRIVQGLMDSEQDHDKKKAYKVMLSYRYMNLGVLCKDSGNLVKAHEILTQSLQLARDTDNGIGISKISGNLGQLYLQENKLRDATEIIYEVYNTVIDKYDNITIQYALMNLGLLEIYNKKYERAGTYFNRILNEYQELDIYVKQVSIDNMYKILTALGHTDQANAIREQTTKLAEQTNLNNNVLFVLDCSGSMAGAPITQCKNSVKEIIINNLTESDVISLFVFNNKVNRIFLNRNKRVNLQHMLQSVDGISASGGTAFYDALITSIEQLNDRENDISMSTNMSNTVNESKWIVALTDGEDQDSKSSSDDVIRLLNKKPNNLIIITVGALNNRHLIQKICDASQKKGKIGKLINVSNGRGEIEQVFKKVIQVITGQLHVESL